MAQRVSFDERARVEAMSAEGVEVAEIARRLGRHRSTVYRELGRCGGRDGYDAEAAQTAASWEALAVSAAGYTDSKTAVALVRSSGEVSFVAANGLAAWPRGSPVQPGGPLAQALRCRTTRARREVYRYGLGGAEALFCDTLQVDDGLAIAVMSSRRSDGGLSILEPVEPPWKDSEEFCAWCNAERDVGWCHDCSGRRCRDCERCGCDVPINNPVCPSCFLAGPIRAGSEVCVDCEADGRY